MKYIFILALIIFLNGIFSYEATARKCPDGRSTDTAVQHFPIDAALTSLVAHWTRGYTGGSYFPIAPGSGKNNIVRFGLPPYSLDMPWSKQKRLARVMPEFIKLFIGRFNPWLMPWMVSWFTSWIVPWLNPGLNPWVDPWHDPLPGTWDSLQPRSRLTPGFSSGNTPSVNARLAAPSRSGPGRLADPGSRVLSGVPYPYLKPNRNYSLEAGLPIPSWINSCFYSLLNWWSASVSASASAPMSASLSGSWLNTRLISSFGDDSSSLQYSYSTGTKLSFLNFEFSYMEPAGIKTSPNGSVDWTDEQTLLNFLRLGYRITGTDPDIIVLFCPKYNTDSYSDSLALQDLGRVKDLFLLLGHPAEQIRIVTSSIHKARPVMEDRAPIGIWTIRSGNYPGNIILLKEGWVLHHNMNGDDLDHFFLRR